MPPKSSFLEKVLGRINRLDSEGLQTVVQRLMRERSFLETLFNTIEDGVLVLDEDGRIVYFNQAVTRLLGLQADDEGQPITNFIPELDWQKISRFDRAGGQGVVRHEFEVQYPRPRFIRLYAAPLDGEAIGSSGVALILHDATEARQRAFEAIESERIQALTLLAASVAHEIGNPLNALHIHLQLMERKAQELDRKEKAELQQSIDVARSEVRRLDSIVTQFLRAIRPSQPRLRPENVNTIVEEAVRFFTPEIQDRDMVVEQELRADLPLLQLDREQIKQAFYNVIKNSLEAMKRHGTLRIRTDLDDTHVIVSFIDTGGGMSAEQVSRAFEPYFTTKPSGTGLGLLIVRRIVREHGGELSIESTDGKGLTLTIRVPYVDKRIRMLEAGENKMRLQEPITP